VDPAGKFAYVTNSGSNDVSMYSIGATGILTLIGTIGT
jgi:DNA-binding beta-propeller fold protein YncE